MIKIAKKPADVVNLSLERAMAMSKEIRVGLRELRGEVEDFCDSVQRLQQSINEDMDSEEAAEPGKHLSLVKKGEKNE